MATLVELLTALSEGIDEDVAAPIRATGCLSIDGVSFSLYPAGLLDPDGLNVYCELGTLPEGDARSAALVRLLGLNLESFNRDAPVFGLHAETGTVVFMTRLELPVTTVEAMRQVLAQMILLARAWEATHFADGAPTAGPVPANPFARGTASAG